MSISDDFIKKYTGSSAAPSTTAPAGAPASGSDSFVAKWSDDNYIKDTVQRNALTAQKREAEKPAVSASPAADDGKYNIQAFGAGDYGASKTKDSRVANIFNAGAYGSGAGFTNTAGSIFGGLSALNTQAYKQNNEQQIKAAQNSFDYWQGKLSSAQTAEEKAAAATQVARAKATLDRYDTAAVKNSEDVQGVANDLYEKADDLQKQSGEYTAKAKDGLGKVGRFAVDLGIQGTQMLGDVVSNTILPGSGLAALATRAYGSAAQEARQSGGTYGQQLAYGLGVGATEVLTEKMFGVFDTYGAGMLDKSKLVQGIGKALSKMDATPVGKVVKSLLLNFGEEATEEVVAGAVEPALQYIYGGEGYNEDTFSNILQDALVGGVMGMIGGGFNGVQNRATQSTNEAAPNATASRNATEQGNLTPTAENPTQGNYGANTEGVQQRYLQEAKRVIPEAAPAQERLNSVVRSITSRLGVPYQEGVQKSVDSIVSRMQRNEASGKGSSVYALKDLARSHIEMKSWDDIPSVLSMLDETKIPYTLLAKNTNQGYRGLHAIYKDGNIGVELQITTPEAWRVKMETEKIYAKWRDKTDLGKMTEAEISEHAADIARSNNLWAQLSPTLPDFGKIAASAGVNTRVSSSNASPALSGARSGPHDPSANSNALPPDSRIIRPAGLTYVTSIDTPPIQNSTITIADNMGGVNTDNSTGSGKKMSSPDSSGVQNATGAAAAGSLNSDYDRLQMQSDTFHPEGANAARPVDVPTTDFEGRNIPKAASTVMGAAVTPEARVHQIEQMVADGKISFDTITDEAAVTRAKKTISEKKFDGALEAYRNNVNNGVVSKDNVCVGQQLLSMAMQSGDEAATAEILSLYARNSTNTAQALQAQTIFRKLSPEAQLVSVQKAVAALNEKHGSDAQIPPEDIKDFLEAETDEGRKAAKEKMETDVAAQLPKTFRAKFDTLRYLAMLGNARTHIRNIIGNTLFQVPVAVKNRVGALNEIIANAVSGQSVERTKSLSGVNPFSTLARECRADWNTVKDTIGQGGKYDERSGPASIEEKARAFSDSNVVGRAINNAADFNSNLLTAEDAAAKRFIYTQSLAGYLKANGVTSIKDADAGLLSRARAYASDEALRNTFNDRNMLSNAVASLGKASKSDNKAIRAAGFVVEGALPFKRTPANILARAGEYSPVGVALGAVETMRGAKSHDSAQITKGLDRVAAGMTGTGLMYLGAMLAAQGLIRGGDDDNDDQAAFDDLTGHQSYALEMKDGTSVTLDWLAPEAIPFFIGVELANSGLDGGISFEDLMTALQNASAPMLEMSMLQGLNDLFDNAAYAKNNGKSVLGTVVSSAAINYVTQVFPTLFGQLERSTESERMTTYTDKNSSIPTDWQYIFGKVSQKLPGVDYHQIPFIDAWGRTESSGSPLERTIVNTLSPAYVSKVQTDAVEKELQKVVDATGETSVFPDRAEKSLQYGDGKTKNLTAEEYVSYAQALGNNRYSYISEIIKSPAYKGGSNADRVEMLQKANEYALYKSKKDVLPAGEYSGSGEMQSIEAAENAGISVGAYLTYRDKTSNLSADKDANGNSISGSKKGKVVAAIDSMGISAQEKDFLFLLNNYSPDSLADTPWHR